MRSILSVLVLAGGSVGCFDFHCDWKDEICQPLMEGQGRLIEGNVLDLAKALPVFTRESFTRPELAAEAKVSGVRVCVVGADPEICSEPSGPDDGKYSLRVPVDGDFLGQHVNLFADVTGREGLIDAREEVLFDREPVPDRTESNRTVYVIPTEVVNALAVESGLAAAGDALAYEKALEKGVGIILSTELTTVGENFAMPKMIDVDAVGAVASLYALTYDSGQPGGFALRDVEAQGGDVPYPMAVAAYVADGTLDRISVELCDRAMAQGPWIIWTEPAYTNGSGIMMIPRPVITNGAVRIHDPIEPECAK